MKSFFETFDDFIPSTWIVDAFNVPRKAAEPAVSARKRKGFNLFAFLQMGVVLSGLAVGSVANAADTKAVVRIDGFRPSPASLSQVRVGLESWTQDAKMSLASTLSSTNTVGFEIPGTQLDLLKESSFSYTLGSMSFMRPPSLGDFETRSPSTNRTSRESCIRWVGDVSYVQYDEVERIGKLLAEFNNKIAYKAESDDVSIYRDIVLEVGPARRSLTFVLKANEVLVMYRSGADDDFKTVVAESYVAPIKDSDVRAISKAYSRSLLGIKAA